MPTKITQRCSAARKPQPRPLSLPTTLYAPGGPIAVVQTRLPDNCLGRCDARRRIIEVDTEGMHERAAWLVLWHEWAHAVLFDTGVNLKHKAAERVCDAIALARTLETLGHRGTK